HMCIDAATRAAADLGYDVTVAHDACATLPLEFDGKRVPAMRPVWATKVRGQSPINSSVLTTLA
ncbi:MAG: isochorismatase family protein, partial [Pseudomonas monteilii]